MSPDPGRNSDGWDVTLPPYYTRQHVRLGYAATEYGNQADTVSIGVTLVTPTTKRRGLYVGATRGRDQNQLLVVTDTDDIAEARDVLEGVLASDRADTPAITQRRDLGAAAHNPLADASTANAMCRPRWVIPDWFAALQHDTRTGLASAVRSEATDTLERLELEDRLIAANNALRYADDRYAPHRDAVEGASEHLDGARRARSEGATPSRVRRTAPAQASPTPAPTCRAPGRRRRGRTHEPDRHRGAVPRRAHSGR